MSQQAANKLVSLSKELQSTAMEVMLKWIIQGFQCQAESKQCFRARKEIEHWSDLLITTDLKASYLQQTMILIPHNYHIAILNPPAITKQLENNRLFLR